MSPASTIARIECFRVPPRWVFLRIEDHDGAVGWGEPTLEGQDRAVIGAVKTMAEALVGREAGRIEDLWQMLYRRGCYRGGPVMMSALSGIDMALWDLKARRLGVPVYELFGGRVRDRVRCYAWMGGDRAETVLEDLAGLEAAGYRAAKFNVAGETLRPASSAQIDAIVSRLFALRDAAGLDFDLAVDFHGRIDTATARVLLREIEPMRPLFVEDPVLQTQLPEMAELARATSVPLAAGERLTDRGAMREMLESGAVRIANFDAAHVGGISEMHRLAALCEFHDVTLAPHCPLGPVCLAASLQIGAACWSASIQEWAGAIHYNQGVMHETYLKSPAWGLDGEGMLTLPEGPGLGIEVDEDAVRDAALPDDAAGWGAPMWRLPDGSVAEW
ncbi:MAG: galactonate dehydratase [Shimia sp.]